MLYVSLVGFEWAGKHADSIGVGLLLDNKVPGAKDFVGQIGPEQTCAVYRAADQELQSKLAIVVRNEPLLQQQKGRHQWHGK